MQIQLNEQASAHFDRPRRRTKEAEQSPFRPLRPSAPTPINMLLECRFCQIEEKISEEEGLKYYIDLDTGDIGQFRKQEYLEWIESYAGKRFNAETQLQRDFMKMLKCCAGDSGGISRDFIFGDGKNTVTINAVLRDICSITSKSDVLWGRFVVDKMPDFQPTFFEFETIGMEINLGNRASISYRMDPGEPDFIPGKVTVNNWEVDKIVFPDISDLK